MSKSFFDSIPEQFRDIYTKGNYNPRAATTDFRVRRETLEKQEAIRKTSNLYQVFGENLFQMWKGDGTLHVDARAFDMETIRKFIMDAVEHTKFRVKILRELGDGKVTVPKKAVTEDTSEKTDPVNTEVLKRLTEAMGEDSALPEMFLTFPCEKLADELEGAAVDLEKYFNESFADVTGITSLDGEKRKLIDDLLAGARGLMRQRLSTNELQYVGLAVRSKGTHRSIALIGKQ